ncbi:MAG: membrane protein [Candidatus Magasanikbacteria bacterium GW2011_GWD2_43_18]|uniref:Membrane protein n=1 Tax=Candidatus Magasanikbacteria bacterium GW2011_GWE2_42_7 TaxID=1619052 RepID=A0A0G1DLS7_9BACT|nr:MAG: membrane protein [Candidatus Magasanikbacteria bacterium GW2011_GWC2_42_27]KKS71791.1 MAG: membrane protein [Candidatus Magasanikbacteria bacterium GW2011_GWE2_42_7]KKT04210.1 MAG: membrane protein [Candidatus Magasanikbacteria bacterium GW2011_GWD2_43_18]KKT25904.1 MAG: membrane protein [Candidatus Magasanikbacteria bacterium GW2011_GWA2_43_9]HBB37881.1 DUF1294 domain-containing protein [Candidatus Magasanikbacteria bacterium]
MTPSVMNIIALYALAVSLVAFFYIGRDKAHARHGEPRTPEAVLWFIALIGGSLGMIFGMRFFHHKTKKISFQLTLALICVVQLAVLVWVLKR